MLGTTALMGSGVFAHLSVGSLPRYKADNIILEEAVHWTGSLLTGWGVQHGPSPSLTLSPIHMMALTWL